ncbi:hypothetical protein RZS08_62160, partial [Arthrospira platensis SPKY1]|nr:hypothetical protein [Arthrospira platensis SPKY1]
VTVKDDAITEGDEIVTLTATSANELVTNGAEGASDIGTIEDDRGGDNPEVDEDTPAKIEVKGGESVEEDDGVYLNFTVKLSNPMGNNVVAVLALGSDAENEAT